MRGDKKKEQEGGGIGVGGVACRDDYDERARLRGGGLDESMRISFLRVCIIILLAENMAELHYRESMSLVEAISSKES